MGTQLNKEAYQKLIDENIEAIEKYMPKHSLEKKHIIEVLKWSTKQIYERDGECSNKESVLPISGVVFSEERAEVCKCVIYHGYEDNKTCSLCKKPLYPAKQT